MGNEQVYTVQEAFELLERYKITSNIESVRRWLRNGTIEGIKPASRKEGWTVTQLALERFIASRMPDNFNTTDVVNEDELASLKEDLQLQYDTEIERLQEQLNAAHAELQLVRADNIRLTKDLLDRMDRYDELHQQHLEERQQTSKLDETEEVRAMMWHEITSQNIWGGYVPVTKKALKDAAEHKGYSQRLIDLVWERCVNNSQAYKQPRISYLLDAFSFEGQRIPCATEYTSKGEQIIYAVFEYVIKHK